MLGEALFAVATVRVALWLLPLATVRRIARSLLSAAAPVPAQQCASEQQILRAVISAGKHCPIGSTCLATALVGQALMNRHGHTCQFRIGVRKDDCGKFGAHAWLEREGKVILNGPVDFVGLYQRLPELEHLIQ